MMCAIKRGIQHIVRKNRVGKPIHRWQAEAMDAYGRIADVIRYLDQHRTEQPDLAALAQRMGLSRFHFHRLFVSWAGVTPKDFLQCLTLAHAKKSLRNGASILDAALDAGLSGPGRLHDLCVNLEAASPGDMKSGGARWTIAAGFSASPFGTCLVGRSPRGICHLSFVDAGAREEAWAALREEWPEARLRRDDAEADRMIEKIFAPPGGGRSRLPLRAFVRGTHFQIRVWRALLQVAPGQLITYGRLAGVLGCPAGARAVGTALGRNPLAYLIPCHRVIRETGVVGDYRWGRARKRALVAWESAQATRISLVK
jgi:AraC family transcriptional regulator of adaptative response/methylated-DNA-[protein]-cysteine methyltransferase